MYRKDTEQLKEFAVAAVPVIFCSRSSEWEICVKAGYTD